MPTDKEDLSQFRVMYPVCIIADDAKRELHAMAIFANRSIGQSLRRAMERLAKQREIGKS